MRLFRHMRAAIVAATSLILAAAMIFGPANAAAEEVHHAAHHLDDAIGQPASAPLPDHPDHPVHGHCAGCHLHLATARLIAFAGITPTSDPLAPAAARAARFAVILGLFRPPRT